MSLRADIAVNVATSGHSRYCRRHLGGPRTSFNNTALAADFGVRRRAKALAMAGVRRRALVLGGVSVGVRMVRGATGGASTIGGGAASAGTTFTRTRGVIGRTRGG